MKNPFAWMWLICLLICLFAVAANAEPVASRNYRASVIRESRVVWGLNAPAAVFGGQIEQESAWNPKACSAYACGLAQFTPSTASDMAPRLGGNDVFNPAWAIRALVLYDHDLYVQLGDATTDCDRWAFVLSAYNGGLGNVRKDKSYCGIFDKCKPTAWWNNVEQHSRRSVAAFNENRAYPTRILRTRQFGYTNWGRTICP